MNEEHFAYRIRQALNWGAQEISPATTRRLEAARHLALSRQKQAAPALALAGGHGSIHFGPAIPYLKQILAVLALLLGMYISFYWQSHQYISELEEVDSALLADDLPPEAFLDQGFSEWLNDSPEE